MLCGFIAWHIGSGSTGFVFCAFALPLRSFLNRGRNSSWSENRPSLFIDHGMGVVIGETAEIGNDVLIYQGVVLGGTTLQKKKRHPTIGNNVVIGSAAILLGPITVGDGARIGANSVVVGSVPPGAIVVGVPGRVVEDRQRTAAMPLEHNKMPDPFSEAIRLILKEQVRLSERLGRLEGLKDVAAASDELTKKIIEIEKAFENKDENNKGET